MVSTLLGHPTLLRRGAIKASTTLHQCLDVRQAHCTYTNFTVMQSLVYSRVAAMVRACQFKIDDTLQPEEIPFCGEATANKIKDIARTGTTSVLEAHRCCLLKVKNSTEQKSKEKKSE